MSKENKAAERRTDWLPTVLYVISAVIAIVFVYMVIVNVMYIKNYLASYGMAFSDMWMDSIQYILTGSLSYLVYAVLVFCAGKIISILRPERAVAVRKPASAGAVRPAAPPAGAGAAIDAGSAAMIADVQADETKLVESAADAQGVQDTRDAQGALAQEAASGVSGVSEQTETQEETELQSDETAEAAGQQESPDRESEESEQTEKSEKSDDLSADETEKKDTEAQAETDA